MNQSAPQSEDRVWEEHMERWRRASRLTPMPRRTERPLPDAAGARRAVASESTAAPPGRLGRRLLADIEPYLEFFALARQGAGSSWTGPATRPGAR
jgi:hypothetical protein